jgi:hypothetical protein
MIMNITEEHGGGAIDNHLNFLKTTPRSGEPFTKHPRGVAEEEFGRSVEKGAERRRDSMITFTPVTSI